MSHERAERRTHPGRPTVITIVGAYQPERCGVAHYCQNLAAALESVGVSTLVFTARVNSGPSPPPGARVVVANWDLRELGSLAQAIDAYEPDIVHIQHAPSSFAGRRAHLFIPQLLRRYGVRQPVVATVHEYGGWQIGRNWPTPLARLAAAVGAVGERFGWYDRELLTLLRWSDHVVATNPFHGDALRRKLGRREDRLTEIPIGPNVQPLPGNPSEHRQALRARLNVPEDAPVLAFFGFIHPVKGLETLLPAFARLRESRPNVRLWLIGGHESLALAGEDASDYCQTVMEQIAAHGLTDSVEVTGYLPDAEVSARLFAADLGVLPFNHGVTLKSGSLLAMLAHGCPVVATLPPGNEPELWHEQHAYLVPPKDPIALFGACARLLDDAALRARLAAGGRSLAARFDWHAIAFRHLRLYAELAPNILTQIQATTRQMVWPDMPAA